MDLFGLNQASLISALIGRSVRFGAQTFFILKLDGYPPLTEVTGKYAPMQDMVPGTIYCVRHPGAMLIVIASLCDGKRGGRIQMNSIELSNGQIMEGPRAVSEALGVTKHKTTGQLIERDNELILFLDGAQPPAELATPSKPDEVIQRRMSRVIEVYRTLRETQPKLTFIKFLAQLRDCDTERELDEVLSSNGASLKQL